MQEVSSPSSRTHAQNMLTDLRLQKDLKTIMDLHRLLNSLILDTIEDSELVLQLKEIGSYMEQISWKEDEKECIRNKHGYRNRHKDSGNNINEEGAKFDFEALSRLKDLAHDPDKSYLLLGDKGLLKQSLDTLTRKTQYLLAYYYDNLSNEQKCQIPSLTAQTRQPAQNDDVGFLKVMAAFYHDRQCLRRLITFLDDFDSQKYGDLDLHDPIRRYQLGYFFTQFGEISKEISEFIKPEHNLKSAEKNPTRFLFGKLGKFRQIIKDRPWVVSGNDHSILQNMLIRFQLSTTSLRSLLRELVDRIESTCIETTSIYTHYPKINSAIGRKDASEFELKNRVDIEFLTIAFDAIDNDSTTQIKSSNENIENEKANIEKIEADIKSAEDKIKEISIEKKSGMSDDSNPTTNTDIKSLFMSILESKTAKQVVSLCSRYDEELILPELTEQELLLCSTIRALKPQTDGKAPDIEELALRSVTFCENVEQHIEIFNREQADTKNVISKDEYSNLYELYTREYPNNKKAKALFDNILKKSDSGSQVTRLCERLSESSIRGKFSAKLSSLFIAIRKIQQHILIKALKSVITSHKENVDKAITKYNDSRKDPGEVIEKSCYEALIPLYQNCSEGGKSEIRALRSELDSLKRKLQNHQIELKKLNDKHLPLDRLHHLFENLAQSKPHQMQKNDNYKKRSLRFKKHESLIYDIIKNTEFIQLVFGQVQKTWDLDSNHGIALIMAEKMCFGIIGQLYKQITHENPSEFNKNLIDTSILSDDCFQSILIRHKQVSHNVHQCDMEVVQAAVKKKVIPWLKDFQLMLTLSLHEGGAEFDEVSQSTPVDERLVEDFQTFDEPNKAVFLRYTKIVALNRFLRSEEALEEYHAIGEIQGTISPELQTELHWQASLAYRNLGRFSDCVRVLEKVIEQARCIVDEPLKLYKLHGAYCDIAIAYIELDEYHKAREFLMQVTTGQKSMVESQIIGANVLLGGIELLEGNELVGQARLELTFIKYFDKLYNFNKIHALSLLCHLASLYLDNFFLESARDCLTLAESILKDYFHEFIPTSGQQAIYYRLMILPILARYKLFEVLTQTLETTDQRLIDLQVELLQADQQENSMTYFTNKKNVRPLAATVLLGLHCPQADDILAPHLARGLSTDTTSLIDGITENVMKIKEQVLAFYLITATESNKESVRYRKAVEDHTLILKKLTTDIVRSYEMLALIFYQQGNLAEAKRFMCCSILYQGITDYVENLITESFQRDILSSLSIHKTTSKVLDQYTVWICESIDINELQKFLSLKLKGGITIQGYVSTNPSIIQEYTDSKTSEDRRDKCIRNAELNMMTAYYLEDGNMTMNIKFDAKRKLQIIRFWDTTEDGSLIIREQAYRLDETSAAPSIPRQSASQPSSAQRSSTTVSSDAKGSSKPFSSKTEALFKGMFGSKSKTTVYQAAQPHPQSSPKKPPTTTTPKTFSPGTEDLSRGMFLKKSVESNSSDNETLNDEEADAAFEEYEREQDQNQQSKN